MQIGLIFDMDGVIVENHQYHYLAWQKIAAKHGITIDEVFYREKMNGRTLKKLMKVVFEREMSDEEAKSIGLEKEAIYRDLYKDHRKPTTGLIKFLEEAKEKGIPMAVGTSAPKENVEFTLDDLDLRKYFVGVVDDSMVVHGKPDPEVYLKGAELVNRKPEDCIVFEDAVSGIQAGKDAGSKVIGLATSHSREELDADLIIDNFSDLSWQQITDLLGK
ncbi:HAD family hydrolase [Marinoscillum pacificum]|uniref:HAD family hydrolase n=1 Tax=Marinoscillum pacificum TaxID=392723 RepID=UPI002157649C|nr:HAD family phosphatase [Marinoscillum pacificum]